MHVRTGGPQDDVRLTTVGLGHYVGSSGHSRGRGQDASVQGRKLPQGVGDGGHPIPVPGSPELALRTASMDSVWMVLLDPMG
jgi:hypothetical protein